MSPSIPLAEPHLGGNEVRYLQECVETNYVSSVGPFVQRFEEEFARYVGVRHAVACSSGTAALHVALLVAGAAPGTTVPVSTFTFVASVNAVTYTGATPLLVDSEPRTWNLDTQRLRDHVVELARSGKPLPPVVEPVHVLGHPADLEPLLELRERFGVRIVEDAAESLGARWTAGPLAEKSVGAAGDLGCFSFNGNKVMTTGGGGMIVTDDAGLADRARHLTTQAKVAGLSYVHDEVGFNYRMTNVAAALGLAQLEQLPAFLDRKREIAERYRQHLAGLEGISLWPEHPGYQPSFWLPSILCADEPQRDRLLGALMDGGVGARPVWVPSHLLPPHSDQPRLGGALAEELSQRGLSLPASVGTSDAQQDLVVEVLVASTQGLRRALT